MLMLKKEKKMRKLAIVLALSLFCAQANAALIGLTQSVPDVTSNFETVSFTVGNHHLSFSGFDNKLNVDGNMITIAGTRTFSIEANLTSTGGFVNGFLVMDGNVASVGANTGVLLTGTLTQFGFGTAADQQLEFKFTVTGGALASRYGSTAGVIATGTGFSGSFSTTDWQNATPGNGNGTSDTFAVPEPATMLVLLVGAAAGALRRRNRRRI